MAEDHTQPVGVTSNGTGAKQSDPRRVCRELQPFLKAAFEEARDGAEHVIHWHRGVGNFRTQMTRLVRRAGLTPWPRIFHNLRASRQTELTDSHPEHVVCTWIGNTQGVARRHYEMVTDEHFEMATQTGPTKPIDSDSSVE